MTLTLLNSKFIPKANGFTNIGQTCYFNAALQGLISCTALSQLITENAEVRNKNTLTRAYGEMLDDIFNSKPDIESHAGKIWNALSSELKEHKITAFQSSGAQEDSSECITLMLDRFESKLVDNLFKHRFKIDITCLACRKPCMTKRDEAIMCTVHASELLAQNLNQYLVRHQTEIDGYVCPLCNAKGPGTKTQTYTLAMVPEIIIVQFKKYESKWESPAPAELAFKQTTGPRTYALVSQTEHSGSMGGGHYWARGLRREGVMLLNDQSFIQSKWESTPSTYLLWYAAA